MDDAKSTTVSKRVARVRDVRTAISKSREIHPIRSDPSPSRPPVASSSIVRPSIHRTRTQKKIVERESNPHLRLAKQPAGGPTEDRARGVRVELGRRPRCRRRRCGRRFLFGAHDEGGPAGGGRAPGRRPRGRPHRAGLSSREAEHFRRALLRGVPSECRRDRGKDSSDRPVGPIERSFFRGRGQTDRRARRRTYNVWLTSHVLVCDRSIGRISSARDFDRISIGFRSGDRSRGRFFALITSLCEMFVCILYTVECVYNMSIIIVLKYSMYNWIVL